MKEGKLSEGRVGSKDASSGLCDGRKRQTLWIGPTGGCSDVVKPAERGGDGG